jgi:hypothetical protein
MSLDSFILSDTGLAACLCNVVSFASHRGVQALPEDETRIAVFCRDLITDQHARNVRAGWWTNLATGERKTRNFGELLMLMVSEIGEIPNSARERNNVMDDKLRGRLMFEVEIADFLIRLWDTAGAYYSTQFPAAFAVFARQAHPAIEPDTSVAATLHRVIRKLSRAMEAHRKTRPDDEVAVPLCEAMILACRLGRAQGLDVSGAALEKIAFNARREDHKIENRLAMHGKTY